MEGDQEKVEEGTCFHCGAPTEIQLGERWICERCYVVRSSCCTEFEEDE
ncbi:hypothetical protein [Haloferula sp.]